MPKLQSALTNYDRDRGNPAPFPVVNMYLEESDTEGMVLQSRPGLADREVTFGDGAVQKMYRRPDTGVYVTVSDGDVYEGANNRGAVTGTGPVSIAGQSGFEFIASGTGLQLLQGGALATVDFFGGDAVKVVSGGGRVIVLSKGTGQFFWTEPFSTSLNALNFATAESSGDDLLDGLFIDDILLLFGSQTVEFWPNIGDDDLPFRPLEAQVLERGIKATGCATAAGNTFAWITDRDQLCLRDENSVISNPGIEEDIAASTSASLFNFFIEGTEFLCVRLDAKSHVYNMRNGAWSEFRTNEQTNWIASCYERGVFGSGIDGKTLEWTDTPTDLTAPIERRFAAGLPLDGGGVVVQNIRVRCNPGQAQSLSDAPELELRASRNAGQTWGDWRRRSLGVQGEYRSLMQWAGLGMFSQPGALFEFRLTDGVPLRVSNVTMNEPFGGR